MVIMQGDTIEIEVLFDEEVIVTGTPTLKLDVEVRRCQRRYMSRGSSTNTYYFPIRSRSMTGAET